MSEKIKRLALNIFFFLLFFGIIYLIIPSIGFGFLGALIGLIIIK